MLTRLQGAPLTRINIKMFERKKKSRSDRGPNEQKLCGSRWTVLAPSLRPIVSLSPEKAHISRYRGAEPVSLLAAQDELDSRGSAWVISRAGEEELAPVPHQVRDRDRDEGEAIGEEEE
jgi:hypothetical protein